MFKQNKKMLALVAATMMVQGVYATEEDNKSLLTQAREAVTNPWNIAKVTAGLTAGAVYGHRLTVNAVKGAGSNVSSVVDSLKKDHLGNALVTLNTLVDPVMNQVSPHLTQRNGGIVAIGLTALYAYKQGWIPGTTTTE